MFGTFRFILASFVLISHVYAGSAFNIGEAAVVNFFVISGYVMTVLIRTHYPSLGKPTIYFYWDRFLRIFPQYLFYIGLTQVCLLLFQFEFFWGFFKGEPSLELFLLNALIVPVNYFFYMPELMSYLLIPAAWSLGLEEQFYWCFPALVLKPWVGRIATLASAVVFVSANCD
jgi:peptidoglycan/LPS O-acetylase OafA/YrhL